MKSNDKLLLTIIILLLIIIFSMIIYIITIISPNIFSETAKEKYENKQIIKKYNKQTQKDKFKTISDYAKKR